MKKNPLSFFILFIFCDANLCAQTDTTFWFVAPEVSAGYANFDRPIVFRITSYTLPATVTVSQPAAGGMPTQTVNIAANSTQSVDLTNWLNNIENKPANTTLNYGIKISSTSDISVYYEVVSTQCACNPEIFVLKGQNAIGTDFLIPSQNFLDNNSGYSPQPYSAFDIVATQNATTVTIIPAQPIVGHSAGVSFNITLNAGQTYSATATGQLPAQHLMGSSVTSDKPIAITYKDDLMSGTPYGGCADLGGDQIVPINLLGTEYIAVDGFLNSPGDKIFVLATQNATSVSVNGVNVSTLNTGQTYSQFITGASIYIQTSAPVYVLQMSGFGCEVGLDILPPIVCTGSFSVSFTRSTTESLYITLLVESGGQGNFLFNGGGGVINSGMFSAVPGTGNQWYAAQILLTLAQTPLGQASNVSNTTSLFHLGFIHGGAGSGCRFGYFSNFNQLVANASAFSNNICIDDTLQLFADSIPLATYSWTGPSGFTSTDQNPFITNAQPNQSGFYTVTVSIAGCGNDQDSVNVQVHLPSNTSQSVMICPGDSYTLPDGIIVDTAGIYNSVLIGHFGCDSIITTMLNVSSLDPDAGNDLNICLGDTAQLQATGGTIFSWNPATDLSDPNISNPLASPSSTIIYTVTVSDIYGCTGTDSMTVTVNTASGNAGPDVQICSGDSIQLNASGGISYVWSPSISLSNPNISNPFAFPATTTNYIVDITNANGCVFSDSVLVTVNTALNAQITADDSICTGDTIQLNVSGSGTNFSWSPATGLSCTNCANPLAYPSATTTYNVIVSTTNCVDTLSVTISVFATPLINAGNDVSICTGDNTQLSASGATSYSWSPVIGLSNALIANPVAMPTSTTTYIVSGTTNGCSSTDDVTVSILATSAVNPSPDQIICLGDSAQLAVAAAATYLWSPANSLSCSTCQNPIAFPSVNTIYTVTITEANGCDNTAQITITVEGIVLTVSNDVTINAGDATQLNASGATNYLWQPSSSLDADNISDPVATPSITTTYTVTGTSPNGCVEIETVTVTILPLSNLFVPNAFSPNGDGLNDEIKLIAVGNLDEIIFRIYNRWGEMVFETDDANFGWDGFYKGFEQEMGTYIYYVRGTDMITHLTVNLKGNITLIR